MRILLAIPAYRCAPQIRRVIEKLSHSPDIRQHIEKAIIFDNDSDDDTALIARQAIQDAGLENWISVTSNLANFGLGGTHKLAFWWAKNHGFDYVIVLHGDDQVDVSQIPDLTENIEHGFDAVLGSRFMRGSHRQGYSKLRTAGNITLNGLYSILAMRRIHDLGSGLNAFKIGAIDFEALESFASDFTFNMDVLLDFIQRHRKIVFQTIHWRTEDQRSNANALKVGWKALATVVRWRLGA